MPSGATWSSEADSLIYSLGSGLITTLGSSFKSDASSTSLATPSTSSYVPSGDVSDVYSILMPSFSIVDASVTESTYAASS